MSREDAQVNFRIPHDLKHKLVQSAHYNRRTVTAELVARLEESFDREKQARKPLSAEEAKAKMLAALDILAAEAERWEKGQK